MSNMSNNLSDYAAREQQRMDESQAMLDEINAMARAEAEAQRYAEQQAAQQYAAQQRMAQQQQAAQQQRAIAQQQAAMRDRQSQLQAQPARSTGGTGSWETAGQSSGGGSPAPHVPDDPARLGLRRPLRPAARRQLELGVVLGHRRGVPRRPQQRQRRTLGPTLSGPPGNGLPDAPANRGVCVCVCTHETARSALAYRFSICPILALDMRSLFR